MRSLWKILLGLVVLVVSFNGMRVSGYDAFGPEASIIVAFLGVIAPLFFAIYHRGGGRVNASGVTDAAISLWPLCLMRLWPYVSSFKRWDYSFTLSASERDVTGFLLYLILISFWAFLYAGSRSLKTSIAQSGFVDERIGEKQDKGFSRWFFTVSGIIVGLVIIYLIPLTLALNRHNSFHSKAWDLAIFAQLSYNIIHGNGLEVSVRGLTSIFSDHFQPIMFIVAALYPLFGGKASALIIIQAVVVATGVIPVALITSHRNPNGPRFAFFTVIIYVLYAPLTFLLLDDFHPIAFIVPLFLWAFYFLEIKRMWPFYIFLILAGCCQEEAWIIVGMVGLYLALFQGMRRAGLILFAGSWLLFFWLVLSFIPSFRVEGDYFYLHRYAYLGSSAGEIAKNVFLHPGLWLRKMFDVRSIAFVIMMLAPIGFLPLRRPKMLFILIPVAFYTLISGYDIQKSVFHQYVAPFIPFLFLSLLDNFREGTDKKAKLRNSHLITGALICSLCTYVMVMLFPIGGHPDIYSHRDKDKISLDSYITSSIPDDQKLSVISKYAPHLANRKHLTLFPNLAWDGDWPDVILIDGKELVAEQDRRAFADYFLGENEGPRYYPNGVLYGFILMGKRYDLESSYMLGKPKEVRAQHYYSVERDTYRNVVDFKSVGFSRPYLAEGMYSSINSYSYGDEYVLVFEYSLGDDFDKTWFLATRVEDEAGQPFMVLNVFPLYGMLADDMRPISRKFFDGSEWPRPNIVESHIIQLGVNFPKPYKSFLRQKTGQPARIRILPMQLPEGWTNTLDEYVTIQEQTVGVNWDNAFVVDLTGDDLWGVKE